MNRLLLIVVFLGGTFGLAVAADQPTAPPPTATPAQGSAADGSDTAPLQAGSAGASASTRRPAGETKDLATASDRLGNLEKRIEEMRAVYELRIGALEREIAALKGVSSQPVPALPPRAGATAQGSPGAAPAATPPPSDLEKQLAEELGLATGSPAAAAPQAGTPASPGAVSPGATTAASPAPLAPGPFAGAPVQQPSAPQPWSPSQPITLAGGGKNYVNLSLDALAAGGSSTARDVGSIETGGHDPNQRGFTIQNVEAVLEGAVDPYFRGQGNIVLQLDAQGNTSVELEEAYLTSTSLPANLQVKGGMYFSEFGRLNATHPHTWDFVDQPLVNGRLLGPDGLRSPGARLSWLMPTPFYSELFVSVQNSQGETAASFRGVPGETVFGRTIEERPLRSAADLLYVPRWSASFDLTGTQTVVLGASAALGPNGSAQDTSTRIYGVDLFWKWKAANAQAGFPFVKWQTEALDRRYEAGAFAGDTNGDGTNDLFLPRETLRDRGAYTQVLWGFARGWILGLRGDYVSGDPAPVAVDPSLSRRWRVSPNLTWFPTEFSKLRLQWNHDHLQDAPSEDSIWFQVEFLLGAHAAHKF